MVLSWHAIINRSWHTPQLVWIRLDVWPQSKPLSSATSRTLPCKHVYCKCYLKKWKYVRHKWTQHCGKYNYTKVVGFLRSLGAKARSPWSHICMLQRVINTNVLLNQFYNKFNLVWLKMSVWSTMPDKNIIKNNWSFSITKPGHMSYLKSIGLANK